ncbi:PREDICTED: stimulator of interferon genes protein, partial [Leptosomus discolor]|uniref:stimulator of interferon genes protein n=1 Tax=Leptosomus discolor TaxID=188344 RepID=UPI000522796C
PDQSMNGRSPNSQLEQKGDFPSGLNRQKRSEQERVEKLKQETSEMDVNQIGSGSRKVIFVVVIHKSRLQLSTMPMAIGISGEADPFPSPNQWTLLEQLLRGMPEGPSGARKVLLRAPGTTVAAAAAPSLPQMSRESRWPSHPTALVIPKAREGRAQRAAYLLLALCAAALYLAGESLVPTARSLTFHFVALQIGVLLKGTCYLAEEIFHLQSSLCQLLNLALGLHKPSAVEMSEMSERSKQNVAHGLAWSYYIGYLKIVLPWLKKSMEEFSRANPNVLPCRETWKLHILVPLSCDVYDDLEKADSNIQYLTDLTETTLTRAGTKKRVYKHSLYAIRDEDNKLWHCAVEYATPLQSLYAMSQDECAAFSREDRLEQAKLFYRTLEEILKGSKECAGSYRLIAYEESGEAETHFLSREILWHLQQQRHEEYAICEGNHLHHPSTTLNSTELNLQISESDLPQPLRSDCI